MTMHDNMPWFDLFCLFPKGWWWLVFPHHTSEVSLWFRGQGSGTIWASHHDWLRTDVFAQRQSINYLKDVIFQVWFMLYSLAACCSVLPCGISYLCIGVEEEGLIYSKLCNHLGKCWPGADCSIAAELQLAASATLVFPKSRTSREVFPLFVIISPYSVWHFCQEGKRKYRLH